MRTERRRLENQRREHREAEALAYWLEITGTTQDQLIADIKRTQAPDNPADGMGIDAGIACRVLETVGPRFNSNAAVLAVRALQTLAIRLYAEDRRPQCGLF